MLVTDTYASLYVICYSFDSQSYNLKNHNDIILINWSMFVIRLKEKNKFSCNMSKYKKNIVRI